MHIPMLKDNYRNLSTLGTLYLKLKEQGKLLHFRNGITHRIPMTFAQFVERWHDDEWLMGERIASSRRDTHSSLLNRIHSAQRYILGEKLIPKLLRKIEKITRITIRKE